MATGSTPARETLENHAVSKSSCCLPEVLLLRNLRTSTMRSDFDVVLRLSTNRTLPINWHLAAAGAAGNRVFSLLERPPRGSSCLSYLHIIKMLNYKVFIFFRLITKYYQICLLNYKIFPDPHPPHPIDSHFSTKIWGAVPTTPKITLFSTLPTPLFPPPLGGGCCRAGELPPWPTFFRTNLIDVLHIYA